MDKDPHISELAVSGKLINHYSQAVTSLLKGPEMRMTAIPALPWAVDRAYIVSLLEPTVNKLLRAYVGEFGGPERQDVDRDQDHLFPGVARNHGAG
jgi:hypothetical protein